MTPVMVHAPIDGKHWAIQVPHDVARGTRVAVGVYRRGEGKAISRTFVTVLPAPEPGSMIQVEASGDFAVLWEVFE